MEISKLYSLKTDPKRGVEKGVWYTPNTAGIYYDQKAKVIRADRVGKKWNYNGSFEMLFQNDFLRDKTSLKIKYRGRGWFSIKLIEKSEEGPSREHSSGWKKLVPIREYEFISLNKNRSKGLTIPFTYFYNKPFNVSFSAFLNGLKKIDVNKISSCEITVRMGEFEFQEIVFV